MLTLTEFFQEGLTRLLEDIPDARALSEANLRTVSHSFALALARQDGQRVTDAIEEMPLHAQMDILRNVCLPDHPASYLHKTYDQIVHDLLKSVAEQAAVAIATVPDDVTEQAEIALEALPVIRM